MSAPSVAWPAGSAERPAALTGNALTRVWAGSAAMAQAELRKLRHDHLDIFTRSVQPLLWLFVFGTALHNSRALTLGNLDYRAYLAPGVMAQAALFIAIFFGLAVIWERDVGQLQRLLATPSPAPPSFSERRPAPACSRSFSRCCCSWCSRWPRSASTGTCSA